MNESVTSVPSLGELRGMTVRNSAGDRLGSVHDVRLDADGRISQLVVRKGWFSGTMRDVPTDGMRMVNGDVIVSDHASLNVDDERPATERSMRPSAELGAPDAVEPVVTPAAAPAPAAAAPVERPLLIGPERARMRFGGVDLGATLVATFVAIGLFVVLGSLLAAWLGNGDEAFTLSTGDATMASLSSGAIVAGYVALFIAYLIGGWAAGRMARYDGSSNGLLLTPWTVVLALISAGLGSWVADKYDVFAVIDLPRIDFATTTAEGVLAVVAGLVVMLVAGALGGGLGTIFHRRADRAMIVDTID